MKYGIDFDLKKHFGGNISKSKKWNCSKIHGVYDKLCGTCHGPSQMDIKVMIEKKSQEKEEMAKIQIGTPTKLFQQTLI